MSQRLFFFVVSVTLVGTLCLAQEAPVVMSVNRPPDGSVTVQIANHHQAALTAYVLEVDREPVAANGPHGRGILYFDSLINPWQNKSFAPGETRTIRVAGPSRGPTPWQITPTLKAAVFEDGTTFGDSDTVALVIAARKMFFEELGKAISLIQTAKAQGMSREELIREATRQQQADLAGAQEPEEKRAVANPWGTLRTNLKRDASLPLENAEEAVLQMFMRLRQGLIQAKPSVAPQGATVNPAN